MSEPTASKRKSKRCGGIANNNPARVHRLKLADYALEPPVETPYIDTHCHLLTTLSMLHDKLDKHEPGLASALPRNRPDLLASTLFPRTCRGAVDVFCDLPLSVPGPAEVASLPSWPENFTYRFAIGAHPHSAPLYSDSVHEAFVSLMSHPACVAWGEIGLDYFKNAPTTFQTQRSVFIRQLLAAIELQKPVVLHIREADKDARELLEAYMPRNWRFQFHCFTAGRELGQWVVDTFPNAAIGITGVVSYAVDELRGWIRDEGLPLERMVLETDAPFMVPKAAIKDMAKQVKAKAAEGEGKQTARGRLEFCHNGMLPWTAVEVAELINEGRRERGQQEVTVEEVMETTKRNAERLYGFSI